MATISFAWSPRPRPEPPRPPDARLYRPFFCPWLIDSAFNDVYCLIAPTTLVSIDRCHVLWTLAHQALASPGAFVECGVYQGGTARLLAEVLTHPNATRRLHLFDTFAGMPKTGDTDLVQAGDFGDTNLERVKSVVGHADIAEFHPGLIPKTFASLTGLEIALAHVDVDIYRSVLDCCEFIYPRLVPGGFIVFDDYGFQSCPGARSAVDQFFQGRPERPLVLPTGQAIVFRCN